MSLEHQTDQTVKIVGELEQRKPVGLFEGVAIRFYKHLEDYLSYKLDPRSVPDYKPFTWRTRTTLATLSTISLAALFLNFSLVVSWVKSWSFESRPPVSTAQLPLPPFAEAQLGEEQTNPFYLNGGGMITYEWGVVANHTQGLVVEVPPPVLQYNIRIPELKLQKPDRLPVILVFLDQSARTEEKRQQIEAGLREPFYMEKYLYKFSSQQSVESGQSHLTIISVPDALEDAAKNIPAGGNFFDTLEGIINLSWANGVRGANNSTAETAFSSTAIRTILDKKGIKVIEIKNQYYRDKFGFKMPGRG